MTKDMVLALYVDDAQFVAQCQSGPLPTTFDALPLSVREAVRLSAKRGSVRVTGIAVEWAYDDAQARLRVIVTGVRLV